MTNAELIKRLQALPPDATAVVASCVVHDGDDRDAYEMHTIMDVHTGFNFYEMGDMVSLEIARDWCFMKLSDEWEEAHTPNRS